MNKKEKINDIIYKLQAFGLKCLAKFFYITGLRFSTIFSSFILMVFAPFTPPSFYAMRNMKMAMPELSFFKRFKILIGMWNNLGKDLAEFVFFHTRSYEEASKYINIDDESHENLLKIKESKLGELLFTAHFGNWELLSQVFIHYGLPISAIYRSMNNKYADDIVLKFRERYNIEMIPKY